MVAHSNKEIKPESSALRRALRSIQHRTCRRRDHAHLYLHRTTALEGISTPDDEVEIVRSELAVILRCAGIGVLRRGKDGRYWYRSLQALLAKCETFQLGQRIALGRAVDGCVLQDADTVAAVAESSDRWHWGCWWHPYDTVLGALIGACILELPSVSSIVVDNFGVIIALV